MFLIHRFLFIKFASHNDGKTTYKEIFMDIRKGTGSTVLLNISGDDIREGTSSSVLFNISGNNIRKGTGSSVLYNTTGRCNTQQLAAILLALNEI